MKKKISFINILSNNCLRMLWICLLIGGLSSCTKFFYNDVSVPGPPSHSYLNLTVDSSKWLDWNIMFPPNTNSATRQQQVQLIKTYIDNYLAVYGFTATYREIYCPCDSSLFNLNATPLNGSGKSYQPPPTPPPPTGGSGGDIGYVASINNSLIVDSAIKKTKDDPNYPNNQYTGKFTLAQIPVNEKIFAVMDTGLDPDLFSTNINQLIWKDAHFPTYRNFTFNTASPLTWENGNDDHPGKHGTAVTTIALQSMGNLSSYPQIMVLKVLDNNERGTTFNVGCALSYAIKNHATVINASLGYYDFGTNARDTVLSRYLRLCNVAGQDSIFVFAAAGNLPLPHDLNTICQSPSPAANELKIASTSTRLFYPACFSDVLPNVISVTGLKDLNNSCIYQNYSGKYVSLGVPNSRGSQSCCQFYLPSIGSIYEGSSFATPVASGKLMGQFLRSSGVTVISLRQSLNAIMQSSGSLSNVTKNGKYIDNGN
ncbi:MAG: S8/S53 family peptidase [Bacteroidetes bacterium]|nr:S8/S53 family peptidase [Bacteroidota bacterium]